MDDFFSIEWSRLGRVVIASTCVYVTILLYTRIVGLRSFSKMSAADFAMTVAVGSLFASTAALGTSSLAVGVVAIGCLFAGQWGLALGRKRWDRFSKWIDNQPLLLMEDGKFLESNLKRANVSKNDIYAKLREANVLQLSDVRAVIFETTGDVSVLHGGEDSPGVQSELLSGVRR